MVLRWYGNEGQYILRLLPYWSRSHLQIRGNRRKSANCFNKALGKCININTREYYCLEAINLTDYISHNLDVMKIKLY